METKILLASHGDLAMGIKDGLDIILGENTIEVIIAYKSENFDLKQVVKEKLESFDFEKYRLVVITDLLGGSVNTEFMTYLDTYSFDLYTNMNLPFVLETVLKEGEVDLQNLDQYKPVYCNAFVESDKDFDDFG